MTSSNIVDYIMAELGEDRVITPEIEEKIREKLSKLSYQVATGYDCSVCGRAIYGASVSSDKSVYKGAQGFAHADCYWRQRYEWITKNLVEQE